MPLTEKELIERDAKRNIGEELLQSIRDVKAGKHGAVNKLEITEAAEARSTKEPHPKKFAEVLDLPTSALGCVEKLGAKRAHSLD
jgi:putative transcriptional regulator